MIFLFHPVLAISGQYTLDWTPIILAIIGVATTWISLYTKKSADKAAEQAIKANATSTETKLEVNSRMSSFLAELATKNEEILKQAVIKAREEGLKQAQESQIFQAKILAEAAANAANKVITEKPLEVKVINTMDEKVPTTGGQPVEVKVVNTPQEKVPVDTTKKI